MLSWREGMCTDDVHKLIISHNSVEAVAYMATPVRKWTFIAVARLHGTVRYVSSAVVDLLTARDVKFSFATPMLYPPDAGVQVSETFSDDSRRIGFLPRGTNVTVDPGITCGALSDALLNLTLAVTTFIGNAVDFVPGNVVSSTEIASTTNLTSVLEFQVTGDVSVAITCCNTTFLDYAANDAGSKCLKCASISSFAFNAT